MRRHRYFPPTPMIPWPRLWIGKTRYTVAAILAFRWKGQWTHVKVVLWYRSGYRSRP